MLISHDKQFLQAPFESEEEFEEFVSENADCILGPGSIYLPKRLIHTRDNFGIIPDGSEPAARKRRIHI